MVLLSKPKSRKATTTGGLQEVTVTVDGGYDPNHIVVVAGQPVRLNFYRKDPSSCLEEVRFPDFRIAQALPVNQTTPIEFTPTQPGRYEFACGMNMVRGTVEVVAEDGESPRPSPLPRQNQLTIHCILPSNQITPRSILRQRPRWRRSPRRACKPLR